MATALVGDVQVGVQGSSAPSDADWDENLKLVEANLKRIRASIMVTDGAHPNSRQREKLRKLWENGNRPRVAVVANSPMVRGAVAVLSWFLREEIKVFPHDQLDAALAYLEVSATQAEEIRATLKSLRAEIELPRLAAGASH